MRVFAHHVLRQAAVLGLGVALVSSAAGVTATAASAAEVTGTMTITLRDDVAYLVTDEVWTGIRPARVGIEPAGSPFPGATLAFPLYFEDGWFKVLGRGGVALGPGGIEATGPSATQTPKQADRKIARVNFIVGNAKRSESPFVIKRFSKVGTDTEGFVAWSGQLYMTRDANVVRTWNELSGLTGNRKLQPGQRLGLIRIETKAL